MDTDHGFKAMSQNADGGSGGAPKNDEEGASSNLKSFGVDTDQMTEAASQRASELQRLAIDEIRDRPLRALGWAAFAGFMLGVWVSR